MGAWGSGLQANDCALDAIGWFKDNFPIEVNAFMQTMKDTWGVDWTDGVLGLTDYLLDAGMSLSQFAESMPLIQEAIAKKKTSLELARWDHPNYPWFAPTQAECNLRRRIDERLEVLEMFEARLQGKPYDQEKMAEMNKGLLTKWSSEYPTTQPD